MEKCFLCQNVVINSMTQQWELNGEMICMHLECLQNSRLFSFNKNSSESLANFCLNNNLDLKDIFPKNLNILNRFHFILNKSLSSFKKNWKEIQSNRFSSAYPHQNIKNDSLLKKRSFEKVFKDNDKGFDLQVYDIINKLYKLKHPLLQFFQKDENTMFKKFKEQFNFLIPKDLQKSDPNNQLKTNNSGASLIKSNQISNESPQDVNSFSINSENQKSLVSQLNSESVINSDNLITQNFYIDSNSFLGKCHFCGDKNFNRLKLSINSQNDSHFLRCSKEKNKVQIMQKNSKNGMKKKNRTCRLACIICLNQNKLHTFLPKKDDEILINENIKLFSKDKYLNYWYHYKNKMPQKKEFQYENFLEKLKFKNEIIDLIEIPSNKLTNSKIVPEVSNKSILENLFSQYEEVVGKIAEKPKIIKIKLIGSKSVNSSHDDMFTLFNSKFNNWNKMFEKKELIIEQENPTDENKDNKNQIKNKSSLLNENLTINFDKIDEKIQKLFINDQEINLTNSIDTINNNHLNERGHFDWEWLSKTFYESKDFEKNYENSIYKKIFKKIFSEFLYLNESRIIKNENRNFLVDFFQKKNLGKNKSLNENICDYNLLENSFEFSEKSKLQKHLQNFEENYLKKFKRSISNLLTNNFALIDKFILFPNKLKKKLTTLFFQKPDNLLPIQYYDSVLRSSTLSLHSLSHKLKNKRFQIKSEFSKRIIIHFNWLSNHFLFNKIFFYFFKNSINSSLFDFSEEKFQLCFQNLIENSESKF